MSRQIVSRPGEPLWLVDERVHQLERRVGRLATALTDLARHHRAGDDWFLDRHPVAPGARVVDVGCGTGEFTEYLAELVPDGQVLGVETDDARLSRARSRQRPNLRFAKCEPHELYLVTDPGTADLVVSRITDSPPASTTADPRFYASAHQVLRPGGWLHVDAEGAGSGRELYRMLDAMADEWGLPPPHPMPDAAIGHDMVRLAGFEVPEGGVVTVAERHEFDRDGLLDYLRRRAVPRYLSGVGEELSEGFWQAVAGNVDEFVEGGSYGQTLVRLDVLARRPEQPASR